MLARALSFVMAAASGSVAGPTDEADALRPGVVVETVERGFTADLGGIRKDDVLLSWSQADGAGGERRGEIPSPFLLADVEYGQLPRGPLVLHGTRAGTPLRVEVAADAVGLGVTLRPRFPPGLLDLYLRGRQQIDAGQVTEGTSLWREAAVRARGVEGGTPSGCWLLGQIGTAWAVATQADAARDAYDEAITCAEDVDARAVATILEWQAWHEVELGAPDVTVAALEVAYGLREAHPDSPPLSGIKCLLDLVPFLRRELPETQAFMLQIVEREAADSLLLARVLQGVGIRQQRAGDLDAAQATLESAAQIAERAGPWSSTWARAQTTLGAQAGLRGDLATYEALYRKAMERHLRYSPDSVDAARGLLNMGAAVVKRGDMTAARHWNEAALKILDRLPAVRNVRAAVLNNLGEIALHEGDLDSGLRLLERAAADIRATTPSSQMLVKIELDLSEARSARGDLAAAHLHADGALELVERLAPQGWLMARALAVRGELARSEGDWDTAEECFGRAIEILDAQNLDNAGKVPALKGAASVLRARGDRQGAEKHLRHAVAVLESMRNKVGRSEEERSLFVSGFHGVYRELIDLLAEQGRMAEALQVLEASRARMLLSMLAARDLLFELDVPAEMERERRSVSAAYERARQRLAGLPAGAADAEALRGQLAELRDRQVQLDLQVREASPRLAELRDPKPLDAPGVAAHLAHGTLLIAYSVGAERTAVFVLEGESGREARGYLIPAGEDELRRQIGAWRKLAEANPPGRRFLSEARRLYALLLGPLAEPLGKAQRVIISADGPLHALPFAALRDDHGYLAETKALAFVPSGTLYAQQAAARASRTWGRPAAFGDPRYAGSLERLPGSRREVSAVAAAFPATRTFLAGQATEEKVKTLDRDSRFVHFAVHGIVDERAPLDSALALSTPPARVDDRDNGLLYAWEVFERVRLDADLVTLSACRSASGRDRPGEGIVGLTQAFVHAGARSVLASLWNVGDASTGPFMQVFYEAWAGGATKAEALRRAQVHAIRRGQRPLRWAGFQLYGDDR